MRGEGERTSLELTFATVLAVALAVAALVSLARTHDLPGATKTLWGTLIVIFPILGPVVWFGVRRDW